MNVVEWWHRHFTRLGRDIAWRERFARRRGYAYPGHVPPRPMPAPAPSTRPVGPISLAERAARFQRGIEVVHSLSPECLRMLREDGQILSKVAATATAEPRQYHHSMIVIAGETIFAGHGIRLEACGGCMFVAWSKRSVRERP